MKINNISRNFIYLCCGFMLLILCFFRKSQLSGVISIIVFSLFFLFFAAENKQLIVKHLFIFFNIFYYSLGNLICEYGNVYLTEMGVFSRYSGSFNLLALLYWIIILTLKPIDSWIYKYIWKDQSYNYVFNMKSINKYIEIISPICIFIFGSLLFLSVVKTPSFSMNVNRFTYSSRYIFPYIDKLKSIPILLAPLIYNSVILKKLGGGGGV